LKIRVSYSELKSVPGYNNRKAEAEIEIEVVDPKKLDESFQWAWGKTKSEVSRQLGDEEIPF
jgi:hypothetical protein